MFSLLAFPLLQAPLASSYSAWTARAPYGAWHGRHGGIVKGL